MCTKKDLQVGYVCFHICNSHTCCQPHCPATKSSLCIFDIIIRRVTDTQITISLCWIGVWKIEIVREWAHADSCTQTSLISFFHARVSIYPSFACRTRGGRKIPWDLTTLLNAHTHSNMHCWIRVSLYSHADVTFLTFQSGLLCCCWSGETHTKPSIFRGRALHILANTKLANLLFSSGSGWPGF